MDGRIISYHIVSCIHDYELEQTVEKYLKDGWELHGSLVIHTDKYNRYFYQVVVKRVTITLESNKE